MNYYSNDKEKLVKIFEDTLNLCNSDEVLKKAVQESISGSIIYAEKDFPKLPTAKFKDTIISLTNSLCINAGDSAIIGTCHRSALTMPPA